MNTASDTYADYQTALAVLAQCGDVDSVAYYRLAMTPGAIEVFADVFLCRLLGNGGNQDTGYGILNRELKLLGLESIKSHVFEKLDAKAVYRLFSSYLRLENGLKGCDEVVRTSRRKYLDKLRNQFVQYNLRNPGVIWRGFLSERDKDWQFRYAGRMFMGCHPISVQRADVHSFQSLVEKLNEFLFGVMPINAYDRSSPPPTPKPPSEKPKPPKPRPAPARASRNSITRSKPSPDKGGNSAGCGCIVLFIVVIAACMLFNSKKDETFSSASETKVSNGMKHDRYVSYKREPRNLPRQPICVACSSCNGYGYVISEFQCNICGGRGRVPNPAAQTGIVGGRIGDVVGGRLGHALGIVSRTTGGSSEIPCNACRSSGRCRQFVQCNTCKGTRRVWK